mmetsp:Transcript_24907/g.30615  ORF Transcript_24907/g.30615 Transcript_24907/m.30615 type:complete len:117 (+) Transcript_24907:1261-1611(+)
MQLIRSMMMTTVTMVKFAINCLIVEIMTDIERKRGDDAFALHNNKSHSGIVAAKPIYKEINSKSEKQYATLNHGHNTNDITKYTLPKKMNDIELRVKRRVGSNNTITNYFSPNRKN